MGLRSPPTVFSDLTTLPRSCLFSRKETWVCQKVICIAHRLTESPTQTYVYAQVKLVSIDAADVADGNPSIILGLIWNIILFFQVIIFCLYILVCLITPSLLLFVFYVFISILLFCPSFHSNSVKWNNKLFSLSFYETHWSSTCWLVKSCKQLFICWQIRARM